MPRNLSQLASLLSQAVDSSYSREEQRFLCRRLCEQIAPGSYALRIADPQRSFSESEWRELERWCSELAQGRPIQYILGESEFYGLTFKVAEGVLIPRPETEELVEWIRESVGTQATHLLDIGIGSGAISLALAHCLPDGSTIEGWDVSEEALRMAEENRQANGLNNVSFSLQDILTYQPTVSDHQRFDLIVSNPPYVMESEKREMKPRVLEFEPSLALFVSDDDPLLFYRTIAQHAMALLRPEGMLFFEINSQLGAESVKLIQEIGFVEVELRKDLNGRDRMIKAIKR